MPSKLEQLQQQYRRQLLQEKEERMIKIHTESQQKALSKVARYNGYSSVPTVNSFQPQVPAAHHSPVKKGSPGVDRSRPLPPISKERNSTSARASPVSAPADNTSKMPGVNSRSKSVDLVDSPRQSPPRGQQSDQRGNNLLRNGYTRVSSETHHQLQFTQHVETKVTQHVEIKQTKPVEPPKPAQPLESTKFSQQTEPKPTTHQQLERKIDPETLARLKQAELQRLRAKTREETPTPPRQNGFSSDTVTRSSSTVQKKAPVAAKPPPAATPARTRPSFQTATAASSRKVAPAVAASRPAGRGAPPAKAPAGRKPPGPGQEQCRICGRNFNADRIEKHATICTKAAQKKVKVFDATKMRVKGTEAEQFVRKGTSVQHKAETKNKSSNWRKKHSDFIEAIRQAKLVQQHLARGGKVSDLPPPPPSDTSDYVQCPHCNRKFSEGVADRHIPKCKNILSNKKPAPRRK